MHGQQLAPKVCLRSKRGGRRGACRQAGCEEGEASLLLPAWHQPQTLPLLRARAYAAVGSLLVQLTHSQLGQSHLALRVGGGGMGRSAGMARRNAAARAA